jgi:serine/threonine protein kinase
VLVHGDIKPCNFLIDPSTLHVTLIDFGGISVLPASFISLSLHARADRFIGGISECLNWEQSKNLPALKEAAGIYAQLGNKRLGKPHELVVFFELTAIKAWMNVAPRGRLKLIDLYLLGEPYLTGISFDRTARVSKCRYILLVTVEYVFKRRAHVMMEEEEVDILTRS